MSFKFRIVKRLEALQDHLGDALAIVSEYETWLDASVDPAKRQKIQHQTTNLAGLISSYKREMMELAGQLEVEHETDLRTDKLLKDLNERFSRFERFCSVITAK